MSVLIGGSCAEFSSDGGVVFPLPNEEEEATTNVEPSPASGATGTTGTTDPGFPASSFLAGLPVALPPGPAAVGLAMVGRPAVCDPFSGFLDVAFGLTAV